MSKRTTMSKSERTAYLSKLRKPKSFDKEWIDFANANVYDEESGEPELGAVLYGKHFADWVWRAHIARAKDMLTYFRNDPVELETQKEYVHMFMLPSGTEDRQYYRAYASLVYYGRTDAIRENAVALDRFQQWLVANVPLNRPRGMKKISNSMKTFIDTRRRAWAVYTSLRVLATKRRLGLNFNDHEVTLCKTDKNGTFNSRKPLQRFSLEEFSMLTRRKMLTICREHTPS